MKKVLYTSFIVSTFLFGLGLFEVNAAALPCSSSLPEFPVCTNKDAADCAAVDGVYVAPVYDCLDTVTNTTGSCCEREVELCDPPEVCLAEDPDCASLGGIPKNCNYGGTLGCCAPPVQQRIPCDRPGDWGCRDISEDDCGLPYFPGAYPEYCGPSGDYRCCVPDELDEGRVLCDPGFGCTNKSETECNQISGGNSDIAYMETCGGNGAEGCCVSGSSDEEFYDDPEDPFDRTFLPDFYKDFDFEKQFANIYNFMLPIGIFISLVMIIVAGYMYMTSTGSPDKVQAASQKLTSAITGAIFIALSLVILKVIINALLGGSI